MHLLLVVLLVACGDGAGDSGADGGATDGGAADGGSADGGGSDGGAADGGSADGGAADGGSADGGAGDGGGSDGGADSTPLPGYGDISGDCDVLDDEWKIHDPFLFDNAIDLAGQPTKKELSEGGLEVYTDGNLGGSSIWSEVFAYELLYRCEGAALLKTEGEIDYLDPGGKKTDLLVEMDGRKVGVSVTRAYHYPPEEGYSLAEATELLDGKLRDILVSADNAAPADAWERSVLHVFAYDADAADRVAEAWETLDPAVLDETLVIVTVSDGDDEFLY
ncbi:MAG: hypothetical protein D6798_03430 [Deltaproteobacteria bacterium]|nr:MAG: hypothetical protein D6798_03430 [Deltaproteobacteria bacterium]